MAWIAVVATYENGTLLSAQQRRCMFRLGAIDYCCKHAGLARADRHKLVRERVVTVPGGQKSVIVASIRTEARAALGKRGILAGLAGVWLAALPAANPAQVLAQTPPGGGADGRHELVAVKTSYLVVPVTVWSDGTLEVGASETLTARRARTLADRLQNLEEAARRVQVDSPGETVTLPRSVAEALTGRGSPSQAAPALDAASAASADLQRPGRRCGAVAQTTGQNCRNWALQGSQFCNVHEPDRSR